MDRTSFIKGAANNPLDRFEFSQSSLQDYVDCQRRFALRYLQRIAWPAVPAAPLLEQERHMQRGQRFHRMVQQYLLGLPAGRLAQMAGADEDEHLLLWWQNFERMVPGLLSCPEDLSSSDDSTFKRFVEINLAAPLDCYRLIATMDMVQVLPDGRLRIFDWKTSLRRPRSSALRARLQTRVYPYLLVQTGAALNGGRAVAPEQVEMTYWFADPTQAPEHIIYNSTQYHQDGEFLLGLISEIRQLPVDGYVMTSREQSCGYCVYRSLCNRGICAGDIGSEAYEGENDALNGLAFELEQIAEINF